MSDATQGSALEQYETATNRLIEGIRVEQGRAAQGESMEDMNAWDAGWSAVEDALKQAKAARDGYQDELRKRNFSL